MVKSRSKINGRKEIAGVVGAVAASAIFAIVLCAAFALSARDAGAHGAAGEATVRQSSQASPRAADQPVVTPADTAAAAGRGMVPPGGEERVWRLDEVAAIVNKDVILKSEVQEQTFFYASQEGISLADSASFASASREVLDRLVEEKVIIAEARKRAMTVSDQDVERAVDGVIQDMIRGTGSQEAFREQLEREGLTEEELRQIYRPRLEAQILASRLVRREVNTGVQVTDSEVETYYYENEEEFPERPESVRLSHIYVSVLPDSAAFAQARAAAERIRERIVQGEDFSTLAEELSADPSGRRGGDLGYFERGELDPRFEEAVFSTETGELAPVVQTRLGFHVIKVTDRRGDEARASHILVPVSPSRTSIERAQAKIESLEAELDAGADFAELAAAASEDTETREYGGGLGYFAVEDLTPDVRQVVMDLRPGEVSQITQAPDGFHIFKMTEYKPKGRFTLEETEDDIREMLRRDKLEEAYSEWIEELKKDAYIEIKGD